MFTPAEMSEVEIFVNDKDIDQAAQTIASLGVMHLLDASALGNWAEGVSSEWSGRITMFAAQERRLLDLMRQLEIPDNAQAEQEQLRPAEDLRTIEEALQRIEEQVRGLRQRREELRRDIERWELVTRSLEVLAPLSISLSDLQHLKYLHVAAGTIPAENISRLDASLFRIPYKIIPVYQHKSGVLIFAFCAEEHAPILERALESAFLTPLSLPLEYDGTPTEVLTKVSANLADARRQLENVEREQESLAASSGNELQAMLSRVRSDRAVAEAMSHFGHRGHVYLIAGWVPKKQVGRLHAAIDNITEGRATVEENPPDVAGRQLAIPTMLENRKLFKPAESLVTIYGLPNYKELDPTPMVALTFVLMFGMMFGDLGQGLLLALAGLVLSLGLIRKLKGLASAGSLLLAAGLSATLFGVLYGSVFGLENVLPSVWVRPMRDIWTLLEVSVIYGVIILNIGFAFRLANAIRQRRFRDAVFDKNGVTGLILYWGLLGLVYCIATSTPIPVILDIVVVLASLALLFAEPLKRILHGVKRTPQRNVAEQMLQSFFELFEAIISYISNTLSYVRLGAFAVAHVGLSLAIVQLVNLVSASTHIAVSGVFVLVLGNLLILALEGLIVGIQTLRLEYYEFFGKFFTGGGIPFKPLALPRYRIMSRERS